MYITNERRQPEKATQDSNYMTFWQGPDYGDGRRISGCQKWGRKRE